MQAAPCSFKNDTFCTQAFTSPEIIMRAEHIEIFKVCNATSRWVYPMHCSLHFFCSFFNCLPDPSTLHPRPTWALISSPNLCLKVNFNSSWKVSCYRGSRYLKWVISFTLVHSYLKLQQTKVQTNKQTTNQNTRRKERKRKEGGGGAEIKRIGNSVLEH